MIALTGVVPGAMPCILADHWLQLPDPPRCLVVIGESLAEAEQLSAETVAFMGEHLPVASVVRLSFPESGDTEPAAADLGETHSVWQSILDRTRVATELLRGDQEATGRLLLIATTLPALLEPLPPAATYSQRILTLRAGSEMPPGELARRLEEDLGYDREPLCEYPGQYSVRGNLLDLYPVGAEGPFRLDYFGDQVESIRPFDPTSQRSSGTVAQIDLTPPLLGEKTTRSPSPKGTVDGGLWDYTGRRTAWILREPDRLRQRHPGAFEKPQSKGVTHRHLERAFRSPNGGDEWWGISELPVRMKLFENASERVYQTTSTEWLRPPLEANLVGSSRSGAESGAREQLLRGLLQQQEAGKSVVLVNDHSGEEQRWRHWLAEHPAASQLRPSFVTFQLQNGFLVERVPEKSFPGKVIAAEAGAVWITAAEFFGRTPRPHRAAPTRLLPQQTQVDRLLDFSALVEGDPLVHLAHGICLFRGIGRIATAGGAKEEVIQLEFADGIRLHLPFHEAHLLSRYIGLTKARPKLGKPGSGTWSRTRQAAERATLDFAAELLTLQAKRDALPGYPFPPDHEWQADFEGAFPFKETPDQTTAIVDIKRDMERDRPADRLLCGDVGFGKTEVALRAIFKAVTAGKQAALLAPTTVLAQQHFQTLKERVADFPVVVEMLSRFRSASQQTRIRRELRAGKIDVVVGTHSLLSPRLRFHDLGLLVIDEEHRFGVRQKERLKLLRTDVDVLSMSATPIPRTLYLALSGARDLSVIETPPRDRLPVETLVKPYSENLVDRAIRYEIGRGGQVFYLHNRVATIEAVAAGLRERHPSLQVAVGHGQMDEALLERIMSEFVEGRHQVLVCTTIIESGLDIPNCNTLIIEGADHFGLSQLYQLRGRVGRFHRQAYAYLLLHRHARLLDSAHKRLTTIRQYNQLGAGYRIALRDLELRGAGNLIGTQQSGQIAGVGFDLYCQLLRQSVASLKGEPQARTIRATVKLSFVRLGTAAGGTSRAPDKGGYSALRGVSPSAPVLVALIPDHWIPETQLRLELHRQLALATTPEAVAAIRVAAVDRFGPEPPEFHTLTAVAEIRTLAEQKGILSVESDGEQLRLRRARQEEGEWVKTGTRFPRLTGEKPLSKLLQIQAFLKNRLS